MFNLDSRLQNDTLLIGDLPLTRVLLMNDSQFPWVILVPRVENLADVIDLPAVDQQQLWLESAWISEVLRNLYAPFKLNVAALGNVVRQLHVHHIARFESDACWPQPVWGRQPAIAYSAEEAERRVISIRHALADKGLVVNI